MNPLKHVIQEPPGSANACVIWLHGLGADGHDFAGIVPQLGLPPKHGIRFIFPHAPTRPITINNGMTMRGWYDIIALSISAAEDTAGIRASAILIDQLIQSQIEQGIPAQRIILAGFSQGGAMALHCGLRYPERLAGILGLSCYVPIHQTLPQEVSIANRSVPIMLAHGTQDPLVPILLGEAAKAFLQAQGYRIEWHTYPIEHAVCLEEIQAIGAWINSIL